MKMKLSSSAKILLFSSIIMITILGGGLLINWVSSEKPFQSFPAVENQLVRLDQSNDLRYYPYTTAEGNGIITSSSILYVYIQYDDPIFGNIAEGYAFYEVIVTEDELANWLQIGNAVDLYLSNGSAKIFYGSHHNYPDVLHFCFKASDGNWYIRSFLTTIRTPEHLEAFFAELIRITNL